jgi:antitoxin component of RelBE/YafQ-DinJ toxin-antitoxin module
VALVKDHTVEKKLSEQIEAVIDALTLSHTQATLVTKTIRKQRISFGLSYSHTDDDIKQMIDKMRYMKRLAERREASEGIER